MECHVSECAAEAYSVVALQRHGQPIIIIFLFYLNALGDNQPWARIKIKTFIYIYTQRGV